MALSKKELQRKQELFNKFKHNLQFSPLEAQELDDLVRRDTTTDEGEKLLILFGLGVLLGYLLREK